MKIRKIGFSEAAQKYKWGSTHKQRLQTLLQLEYMSSESSAEENDEDDTQVNTPVLKVKKITWLKKKYRQAFRQIDSTYYNSHKKSRDKLKKRIPGGNSARPQPTDVPKFAVKSEYYKEVEQNGELLDTSTDSAFADC